MVARHCAALTVAVRSIGVFFVRFPTVWQAHDTMYMNCMHWDQTYVQKQHCSWDSVAAIEFSDHDFQWDISAIDGYLLYIWTIFSVRMRRNDNISTSGPKFIATIVASNVNFLFIKELKCWQQLQHGAEIASQSKARFPLAELTGNGNRSPVNSGH